MSLAAALIMAALLMPAAYYLTLRIIVWRRARAMATAIRQHTPVNRLHHIPIIGPGIRGVTDDPVFDCSHCPDLAYSMGTFDLTRGPLRIRCPVYVESYWSLALYASNADCFFRINDRDLDGDRCEIVLQRGHMPAADIASTTLVARSPTSGGFCVLRIFVRSAADVKIIEHVRASLTIEPCS